MIKAVEANTILIISGLISFSSGVYLWQGLGISATATGALLLIIGLFGHK